MSGLQKYTDPVADLVAGFTARRPVRAGSVIVTIYGDAIAPRGGEAWVGSLLPLLESLGINDSQVRTALSRLSADGWFDRQPVGRRSYYGLSRSGRRRFEEATRRIYGGPPSGWEGAWRIVVIPGGPTQQRELLRKELGWLGFGELSPNTLIHPNADLTAFASVVEDLPEAERPVVIAGESAVGTARATLRGLVSECWNLDGLGTEYGAFCARFRPLAAALESGLAPGPLPALQARILLIHDYRRLILRDPMLPPELLPDDWVGWQAFQLAAAIYRALVAPAERWLDAIETRDGPLPAPNEAFFRRFGGLPST
jgi:phenylacetic acid degradation operon negative regulatory protein